MKKLLLILLILPTLLLANAKVAVIAALKGNAQIEKDGISRVAKIGTELFTQDKIITSNNTKVQVIFNDQTIVSIGKNSKFAINDYVMDGSDRKVELALFSGAMRTITGQIGKIAPNKFKVKMKTSTIGIRGTNFLAISTPQMDTVACTLGATTVQGIGGGPIANVPAGFMANINPAGEIGAVVPFTPVQLDAIIETSFGGESEEESSKTQESESSGSSNTQESDANDGESSSSEGENTNTGDSKAESTETEVNTEGETTTDNDVVMEETLTIETETVDVTVEVSPETTTSTLVQDDTLIDTTTTIQTETTVVTTTITDEEKLAAQGEVTYIDPAQPTVTNSAFYVGCANYLVNGDSDSSSAVSQSAMEYDISLGVRPHISVATTTDISGNKSYSLGTNSFLAFDLYDDAGTPNFVKTWSIPISSSATSFSEWDNFHTSFSSSSVSAILEPNTNSGVTQTLTVNLSDTTNNYIKTISTNDLDANDAIAWGSWSLPYTVTNDSTSEHYTNYLGGFFVIGQPTDTTTVAGFTNTSVSYTGHVMGSVLKVNPGDTSFATDGGSAISVTPFNLASGFSMTVDFGADTVSGSLNFTAGTAYQASFSGSISNNTSYSATLTRVAGNTSGTFIGSGLTGRFYGADGKTTGGQFRFIENVSATEEYRVGGVFQAKTTATP